MLVNDLIMYHSAFSCNRRYSVSNWLDYKVITTAYPCEVSCDALIQTIIVFPADVVPRWPPYVLKTD
jgi:hypothetical protein